MTRWLFRTILFGLSLAPQISVAGGDWLHVSGNQILMQGGGQWYANGVNVMDSRLDNMCYSVDEPNRALRAIKLLKDAVAEKNARFIRIPLNAMTAGSKTDSPSGASDLVTDPNYLMAVKSIVDSVKDIPDVYVMLSLWYAPSMPRNPYWLPSSATGADYNQLVDTFGSYPYVIFGVSNEPHDAAEKDIKDAMEAAVQIIRDREANKKVPNHLIAVQGKDYSSNLDYYQKNPILAGGGGNIIYEAHFYDQKQVSPVLAVAKTLPVIIGEYGPGNVYDPATNDWQNCKSSKDEGNRMSLEQVELAQKAFRAQKLSYAAWSFHESTPPNMLSSAPYESSGDPNQNPCVRNCSVGFPIPKLTSFGEVVVRDLQIPYGPLSEKALGVGSLVKITSR